MLLCKIVAACGFMRASQSWHNLNREALKVPSGWFSFESLLEDTPPNRVPFKKQLCAQARHLHLCRQQTSVGAARRDDGSTGFVPRGGADGLLHLGA